MQHVQQCDTAFGIYQGYSFASFLMLNSRVTIDITLIDKGQYFLIMEWADGGNLEEFLIDQFQSLTLQDKLKLARGIANGIGHLHERNIIHRDLVSNNCPNEQF